jgi:hypothetical protein
VLRGAGRLNGLRNRDVAEALYGGAPRDATAKRRRVAKVCRLLQLLRAHGLIAKVPHSRRYRVTDKGEAIMGAAIYVRHKAFPNELQEAA